MSKTKTTPVLSSTPPAPAAAPGGGRRTPNSALRRNGCGKYSAFRLKFLNSARSIPLRADAWFTLPARFFRKKTKDKSNLFWRNIPNSARLTTKNFGEKRWTFRCIRLMIRDGWNFRRLIPKPTAFSSVPWKRLLPKVKPKRTMQRDTHRGAGRNLQRYSATLTAMWLSSFSGLIFCDNFFILFLTNIPDWAKR